MTLRNMFYLFQGGFHETDGAEIQHTLHDPFARLHGSPIIQGNMLKASVPIP